MSQKIQVKNIRHGNPGLSGWYAILPEPEPTHVLEEELTAGWLLVGVSLGCLLQDGCYNSGKKRV